MIDSTERLVLLRLARDAIIAHVTGLDAPSASGVVPSRMGGAFVSLHRKGELRGCIGHIEADQPLGHVVASCAVAACSADPRFAAVAAGELRELEIELSVLGPLEAIAGPADVEIGRHGLVVERGWHRGLLLPQVATEWGWDADMFLAQTCRKAGLPLDAWTERDTRIWRFDAEVFGEGGGP